MTTCTIASRTARTLLLLCLFAASAVTMLLSQTIGPPVAFVSTFSGGQVIAVDANGVQTPIFTAPADLEGLVLGPDGNIYACAPDQNKIFRFDQHGGNVTTIFTTTAGQPTGPEGPSFGPGGDLYFNTKEGNHTGVWKITAAQLAGTTFPVTATQVLSQTDDSSTFGEGTAFDEGQNLIFVDRSGGKVDRFSGTVSTVISGLTMPIGVAVNSTGDIFVSNFGATPGAVLRYSSVGAAQGSYVTFGAPDTPVFLQFDLSDNLYVVTVQDRSSGTGGKLWKIPPSGSLPSMPVATFATAVGVTAANVTDTHPLSATGPVRFFGGAFSLDVDVSDAVSKYGFSVTGKNMIVTAEPFTKGQFANLVAGDPNAGGSDCPVRDGTGGRCLCYTAKCFFDGEDPSTALGSKCGTSPASDLFFTDTFTTADRLDFDNASFFTGADTEDGFLARDFHDILTDVQGFPGIDPIIGGTRGTNSIFCAAENAPITITITSPTGTNYTLGQQVQAKYQCNPSTVSCMGTVLSGNNIDTSTVGSHDFTVTGTTGTNTATKTVTYTVGFGTSGACLLYDPTKMVKSGAVLPLKLYLCDAAGHDVSSSTTVLHAISVKLISSGTTDTALLSPGSAQPDNNFRYDSTLGPSGGYIFNFDTSGKHGIYNMFFTATGDPNVHTLTFQVK